MSSGWKVFLTVVVVLVVIGLVIGGGMALYRLGYTQALAASGNLTAPDRLPGYFGRGMPCFDGGRGYEGWGHGGMMWYGGHMMPFGMYGFGGGFIGLLVLAGIITLIVLGIRALTREHATPEIQTAVTRVSAETAIAKPARGTRRTK